MQLRENKEVKNFLRAIVQGVKLKEAHQEVQEEYLAHIEDSVENKMQPKLNQDQAIKQALADLGSPEDINENLRKVHKPTFDFLLSIPVLALSLISLFALSHLGFASLQSLWILFGAVAAATLYFTKPSTMTKYSPKIYLFAGLILVAAHLFGSQFDGHVYLPLGAVNIDMTSLTLILFFVSTTGMLTSRLLDSNSPMIVAGRSFNLKSPPLLFCATCIPLIYFSLIGAFSAALLFFIGTLAALVVTRQKAKLTIPYSVLAISLLAINEPLLLSSAKIAASNLSTAWHTDFILQSLSQSSPWLISVTIGLFTLVFVRSLMAAREVKNEFGSTLITGFTMMLIVSTTWGFAANFANMPIPASGMNIPFLSYGGTMIVANFAMIGLILGAIRRKSLTMI